MKKMLVICGLSVLLFQSTNAAEVSKKQDRIETTITCAELEGAATWGVTILEDKSSNKFWAQVKYEVVEYECDDISDDSRVGMRCNQTGGVVALSSPKVSFDSCEIKNANSVICKNEKLNSSNIIIKLNKLNFKFEMNGENGVQLTELLNSVTASSKNQSRVADISNCTIKTAN